MSVDRTSEVLLLIDGNPVGASAVLEALAGQGQRSAGRSR